MATETSADEKPTLKEKASVEFRRSLVIFLYLWVVFGLLSIHKSIVMSQHHLDTEEHAFAIINALVFAKVLLVGEHFNLGTRFAVRKSLASVRRSKMLSRDSPHEP